MSEYSASCIDMRADEVLISAEADVRRPLSGVHDNTQSAEAEVA